MLPISTLIAINCIINEEDCWEWQGASDKDGYGVITYEGQYKRTHREMLYTAKEGSGLACHHCNNTKCCNPSHLYWGDAASNAKDMIKSGNGKNQFLGGDLHFNSKLTKEQVSIIRNTPKTRGSGKLLAEKYGVSASTITEVRNGNIYK